MNEVLSEIAGRASLFNINMILFLGIILFGGAIGGRLFSADKGSTGSRIHNNRSNPWTVRAEIHRS